MKKLFMVCVAALALSACGSKTNQNQATEEAAATTECCEQHAADATCEEGEACCGNKEVCDLEKAYNDLKALGDKLTDAQKEEMAKLEKAIEDAKAKAAEVAANAEAKVEEVKEAAADAEAKVEAVKEAAEGVKDALKNLK
ncbi:MAG: hypothetical protein J6A40_08775 [Bacteroides sp.]|nr:hypothetical protein [Bacteroides sp.]